VTLLPLSLAVLGCEQADEIRQYQAVALRQPEPAKPPADDGMLAAVVLPTPPVAEIVDREQQFPTPPEPQMAWFFKLAGPVVAVHNQAGDFHKFVESVHFAGGKPQYEPPAEWKARGPGQMRYETFEIPVGGDEKPLELSVTTLPRGDQEEAAFLLANINRWRGQMGLAPISEQQLAEGTVRLTLADGTATLVSLVGKLQQTGRSPPFAPKSGAGDGK
jgi:hypothetical protein